jgi:Fe-S-cluster containining protein
MSTVRRGQLAKSNKDLKPVLCIDNQNGEIIEGVNAGSPGTFLRARARFNAEDQRTGRAEAHVPCHGCTACCYHKRVPVLRREEQPEDLKYLDMIPDSVPGGDMMLRRREDGACVHLGPTGCGVHAHRPHICRKFDCRVTSLAGLVELFDGDRPARRWAFNPIDRRDHAIVAAYRYSAEEFIAARRRRGQTWTILEVFTYAETQFPERYRLFLDKFNCIDDSVLQKSEAERKRSQDQLRKLWSAGVRNLRGAEVPVDGFDQDQPAGKCRET